ncbi:MAG: hypothetical protein Athens101410_223 [Parcubacteria group bacterium Athens1014_10]|nr:MAG: hypothetical protein Athens101410_223 [Parcubacteria group bacterium Athens1014_10]TSD04761.1 MAG: hypothetical protein Athens071412_636 [Parcubacteria group bacterium Athens0714_12]
MKKRPEVEAVPSDLAREFQDRSFKQLENMLFEEINTSPLIIRIVFDVTFIIFLILGLLWGAYDITKEFATLFIKKIRGYIKKH